MAKKKKNDSSSAVWTIVKKILNHFIVKNVLILMAAGMLLLWLTLTILRFYTNHGESLDVPDVRGLKVSDAEQMLRSQTMRCQLTDSVYVSTERPGAVINQYPEPGSSVKKNRNVYVIVNALAPEKVKIPKVVGVSLRQAKSMLEMQGLFIGKLTYVPDIAKDYVLRQLYRGADIRPATEIVKGSEIELVLGSGLSAERTEVPSINGYTIPEAREILTKYSLNFGVIIYDNSVETRADTLRAVIFQQKPGANAEVQLGSPIDVWLRVNE
jgi:beta-lactam-binding protein with PASTA domain